MKVNTDERRRIRALIEQLNEEIQDAENKKAKAEKKIHPIYNKLKDIEKGIKELEKKLTTTSTDGKQEKALIKEMQFIKESRPFIQEVESLRDIIFNKKKEKYEIGQPYGVLKEEQEEL